MYNIHILQAHAPLLLSLIEITFRFYRINVEPIVNRVKLAKKKKRSQ